VLIFFSPQYGWDRQHLASLLLLESDVPLDFSAIQKATFLSLAARIPVFFATARTISVKRLHVVNLIEQTQWERYG
jgi:hypothetical protein